MKPALLFYCQHSVGLGHLMRSYALCDRLAERFRVVLIAGSDEFAAGTWQVKLLATGEQRTVSDAELLDAVQQSLNPA